MSGTKQNPQSQNGYNYANDNPINFSDPSGEFAFLPVLGWAITAAFAAWSAHDVYQGVSNCDAGQATSGAIGFIPGVGWASKGGKIIKAVLPGKTYFSGTNAAADAFAHLQKYHGLDPNTASTRLHKIKQSAGLGGATNVTIGATGDAYDPAGNLIGYLTDTRLGR